MYSEIGFRFVTIYEDIIGFNHAEMAYYIRALREQNYVLRLNLPHKKFHSAQSADIPNALNLALISVNGGKT